MSPDKSILCKCNTFVHCLLHKEFSTTSKCSKRNPEICTCCYRSNASDEQQRNQILDAQQVVQPQPTSGSGYSHEERFCDAEQEIHLSEEEEGAHCQQSSGSNTSAAKVCRKNTLQ